MTNTKLWSIKEVANAFKKHGIIQDQEPSGDLISRDAVIDIIHLFFTEEVDKIPTKKTEDGEVYVIHKCQPLFEMNKAICKRIKALPSASPTQNCVGNALDALDCISRQAVLEMAYDMSEIDGEHFTEPCMVVDVEDIQKLPFVNPQEPKWIPVSKRLPELNRPLLVTAYHRVCYAHMISESGNYGYPVFRLHEIRDSDRGWVQETISHEPYSKGRIDAWMYIDIPEPYKAESEDKE